MAGKIIEQLIDSEAGRIPTKLRHFLFKERSPSQDEQTLLYFAHGYAAAFEDAAEQVLSWWPRRDYLRLPAFYLCRHSLELVIKGTSQEVAAYDGLTIELSGHKLMPLWRQMLGLIEAVGLSKEPWSAYCGQIVEHIHDADPDGERFRYPVSIRGMPFDFTRVEFEDLVRAHWNVTAYCDAVRTELSLR